MRTCILNDSNTAYIYINNVYKYTVYVHMNVHACQYTQTFTKKKHTNHWNDNKKNYTLFILHIPPNAVCYVEKVCW